MKKYSYHGFDLVKNIFSQIGGWITLLIFALGSLFLIFYPLFEFTSSNSTSFLDDPRIPPICLGLLILFIALYFSSLLINSFPIVWINDSNLTISYFSFFHKTFLWSEIVDIGKGKAPERCILVRIKKFALFYYVIGWIYTRSFIPAFLIGINIDNFDSLVDEIRLRIHQSTTTS